MKAYIYNVFLDLWPENDIFTSQPAIRQQRQTAERWKPLRKTCHAARSEIVGKSMKTRIYDVILAERGTIQEPEKQLQRHQQQRQQARGLLTGVEETHNIFVFFAEGSAADAVGVCL